MQNLLLENILLEKTIKNYKGTGLNKTVPCETIEKHIKTLKKDKAPAADGRGVMS